MAKPNYNKPPKNICARPRCNNPAWRTYCSGACGTLHRQEDKMDAWLSSELIPDTDEVPGYVRRCLHEVYEDACQQCNWSEKHPVTQKVPLQIHHIDGDASNNIPNNLKLLCPNCHALTKTYMALNKGQGRQKRYKWKGG